MEVRRGLLFALAAYVLWGAFPLYFPLLDPSGPFEILAHRLVWTALLMTVVVAAMHKQAGVRAILTQRRTAVLEVAIPPETISIICPFPLSGATR